MTGWRCSSKIKEGLHHGCRQYWYWVEGCTQSWILLHFPALISKVLLSSCLRHHPLPSSFPGFVYLDCRSMKQECFIQQHYSTLHNANLLSRNWRPTSDIQRCTGVEATMEAAWYEGWTDYWMDKERNAERFKYHQLINSSAPKVMHTGMYKISLTSLEELSFSCHSAVHPC